MTLRSRRWMRRVYIRDPDALRWRPLRRISHRSDARFFSISLTPAVTCSSLFSSESQCGAGFEPLGSTAGAGAGARETVLGAGAAGCATAFGAGAAVVTVVILVSSAMRLRGVIWAMLAAFSGSLARLSRITCALARSTARISITISRFEVTQRAVRVLRVC